MMDPNLPNPYSIIGEAIKCWACGETIPAEDVTNHVSSHNTKALGRGNAPGGYTKPNNTGFEEG